MMNKCINDKETNSEQMYICTEIAAAESISGINYKPIKANQEDDDN